MTLQSIEQLVHPVIFYFYSQIIIVYINSVRKILWNQIFRKIRVISFTMKTKVLNYQYRLGNSFILQIDCFKDLGVLIDCKLHFHHVEFLFSPGTEITAANLHNNISFFHLRLLMLYFASVRSKLEYASVAWNSVTIIYSNKLERIQRQFDALFHKRFFQDMQYHYGNLLEKLNLLTMHNRRRHFDALFLINVFSGTRCCRSKQTAFVCLLQYVHLLF
jgi:hypothetical protein